MDSKLEFVIISYNNSNLTKQCIRSVLDTTIGMPISIIVVDNASTDNSVKEIEEKFPFVKIIKNNGNLGYAAAVNIGVNSSDAEFVIISNNDVIYHPNSITGLIDLHKKNPEIGVAGPQQLYPDGSWQYSYGGFPGITLGLKKLFFITPLTHFFRKLFWNKFNIDRKPKEVEYIDGAVHAIRKKAFDELGGFDEDFFFYTEEADFCFRLRKNNWKVVFEPRSVVTHIRGGSSANGGWNEKNTEMFINTKVLFCKKHYSLRKTKTYILLELLHDNIMSFLWGLIAKLPKEHIKEKAKNKKYAFTLFGECWKKKLTDR